jgi:hypothetical protein
MPVIVTKGFGPGPSTFNLVSATPGPSYIDLLFDEDVGTLTLQAADPSFWTFTTTGLVPISTVSVSIIGAETVRVVTTEPHTGDSYTLTLPSNGLKSVASEPYNGVPTVTFTGIGIAPTASQTTVIDSRHVRLVYSEPVQTAEAIVATNYSISPPLAVLSVSQETSTTYVVNTAPQVPGTSYLLTISNVKDLANNPV